MSRTVFAGSLWIAGMICQTASADDPLLYAPGQSSVRHAVPNQQSAPNRQTTPNASLLPLPDASQRFSGRRIYDLRRYTPPSRIYEEPMSNSRYGGQSGDGIPFGFGFGYGYWPGYYWGSFYPYGGYYYGRGF